MLLALVFQGGLSFLSSLIVMLVHLRNDTNDTSGSISLFHWYCAMCPPLLLTLVLYAVSRCRFRVFSEGLLIGIVVVSVVVFFVR